MASTHLNHKDLTDHKRNKIAGYLSCLASNGTLPYGARKKAADYFGVSVSTIYRIWQRNKSSGDVLSKKSGNVGRKKKDVQEKVSITSIKFSM